MIIFRGQYRWDGTKSGRGSPIAWFSGAYEVRICTLPAPGEKIEALKTHLCIYRGTGEGQSISANPEKFAKQLAADFALNIERVLWVEETVDNGAAFEVVSFTRSMVMGSTVFYLVEKRKPTSAESTLIEKALGGGDEQPLCCEVRPDKMTAPNG